MRKFGQNNVDVTKCVRSLIFEIKNKYGTFTSSHVVYSRFNKNSFYIWINNILQYPIDPWEKKTWIMMTDINKTNDLNYNHIK